MWATILIEQEYKFRLKTKGCFKRTQPNYDGKMLYVLEDTNKCETLEKLFILVDLERQFTCLQ